MISLSSQIEHTLLKPTTTLGQCIQLLREAEEHHFAGVCIPPCWVGDLRRARIDSKTRIITVVGFPLGYNTAAAKAYEAERAVEAGADEVDMVINLSALKSQQWEQVESDIRAVVEVCGRAPVKVILETCYLTPKEIVRGCELSVSAGAAYVKTSTGFGPMGATVEGVKLMRKHTPLSVGIKAAGGIRTAETAQQMVDAGATRIGTSSGVNIIRKCATTDATTEHL